MPGDVGPRDARGTALDTLVPPSIEWPVRGCELTLRHTPPLGASSVLVAGEFTDWESAALPMRDDDGDGTFELTLAPSARLEAGTRYAYRLIVDGDWRLDPRSALRRYVDDCQNSALELPPCEAAPEIVPGPLTTTFDPASATGRFEVDVQVLVATDRAAPTVTFTLDGARLDAPSANATGTFALQGEALAAGRHVLSIRARDSATREAAPVDLPFWIEPVPFDWRGATMYMIVVDRFANGDRANDSMVGAPVERPADFHGGDLAGITEVIESGYFDSLGVDALWLSPINRQADGHFEGRDEPRRFAGYHGYWPSRGREVEPRFGSVDELRALVDAAHARGIRVLLDLINNQVHEQHEYFTATPGWFRTGCVCGIDPGCGWSERPLDCLFASYLPDIDWRVPAAEDRFIDDAVFWVSETGVDGFRIDAVKHVEPSSIVNLRAALHRRFELAGARTFLIGETAVGESDSADYGCGETYASGYDWIDAYVGERALDGQFDFPTHHRLQNGLLDSSMSYVALEQTVAELSTRYAPDGVHVRFLGTHDSDRMASRAALDPARGCRWADSPGCSGLPMTSTDPQTYARLRRAFTVLFTLPGIPFIYYGDEIGMPGGNDPDNRRDMIWTDSLSALANGSTSLTAEQAALREHVRALGGLRRSSAAFRNGRRVPLFDDADLWVVAFADDDPGELAVVAVNRGAAVDARVISGLTGAMIGDVVSFDAAVGTGSARLDGRDLTLTVPAGRSAVFVGN